ncbi:MAG TPA: TonB family protein [Verrucomicrobiae bacterium]|nr:TonB family protein [Verrucomicrobiae bacterium]
MVGALVLLLAALGMLLYNDRDFWFPDTQEADSLPGPANTNVTPVSPPATKEATTSVRKRHTPKAEAKEPALDAPAPPPFTATRTVLPPLQVEVVANNVRRTLHPENNSVHVDLQPGSSTTPALDPPSTAGTPAAVISNAAENVQMSADTDAVVSHSVKPGYPLLARQMKVQGSVILRALINKNGQIEDLSVLSGPPILASAAQEAVRQWRFKPHFLGSEPVETQARITVNFTISTN